MTIRRLATRGFFYYESNDTTFDPPSVPLDSTFKVLKAVFRIRIRPDPKLFGLRDPDPKLLISDPDPDPDPDPSLFRIKLRNMFLKCTKK